AAKKSDEEGAKPAASKKSDDGKSAEAAKSDDSKKPATLTIKVSPWAQVWVDGKSKGMTPLEPLQLKPGKHTVRLENKDLNVKRTETVTLKPGEEGELKIKLSQQ
ncbi:MAG: PEGA domain-containing protein, partial [Myxococcota bacterium]